MHIHHLLVFPPNKNYTPNKIISMRIFEKQYDTLLICHLISNIRIYHGKHYPEQRHTLIYTVHMIHCIVHCIVWEH